MTSCFIRRAKKVKDRDHGQSLTEETLTEYLEGVLDPVGKAASEVHLVSCGDCRKMLAFYMNVLQPEVTSDEREMLEVITAQWDKKTTNKSVPRRKLMLPRLLAATATVAV